MDCACQSQKNLGLPITEQQIDSMLEALDKIDLAHAEEYEKKFRHDVMAHIHAFGDLCPEARGDHPPGSDLLFCHR